MNMFRKYFPMQNKCQPNEFLYLVFLIIVLIKICSSSRFFYIEIVSICTLLIFSMWLYFGGENNLKNKIKIFLPIISVPIMYGFIGNIVSTLNSPKKDSILQKIDQFLVGGNLSLKLNFCINPFLTELMYVCYMLFFYYIISTLIHYIRRNDAVTKSFYIGLFSIYWIGFSSYLLLPATGPYIDMIDVFKTPLKEGLFFSSSTYEFIYNGSNKADVFPSLHCSVSAFCLFFDMKHNRKRFWLSLFLCIIIWISTIYLRYHYFIDVLAGFCLTAFSLFLAKRFLTSTYKKSML